jgi:NAD(P)-dependent dehydrogenase (short-subunit alcohol dehydrogenase family)
LKKSLKDKIVFITGASLGIGTETAYKFAEEGCKLAITYYRDKEKAVAVSERCKGLGAADVLLLHLDVTNNESIIGTVRQVVERYREISVLVNNAGVIVWKQLKEQSFEEIESQLRTNLEGLVKITKESLPYVKDAIINVGSAVGKSGYGDLTPYCATKFGVRGFSQALALELPGVMVYTVNPTVTATRMNDFHGMPPENVARIIVNTAKGEYGVQSGSDIDVWKVLK